MSDEAVYRTALATLGLLNIVLHNFNVPTSLDLEEKNIFNIKIVMPCLEIKSRSFACAKLSDMNK